MADMIRPIDNSGLLSRSHEVSNLKQNEDNKPLADQQNIQHLVHKDVQRASKEVVKKNDADYHQTNYDAKEKGRGQEYEDRRRNTKQSQHEVKDRIIKKGETRPFDIKI